MGLHPNAALTVRQRQELQRLRRDEGWTLDRLAAHFHVNRSTVLRWTRRESPADRSAAPKHHGGQVVTDAYRAAVIAYRHAHPHHGPQRIAHALRAHFPTANNATIWRILHAADLIGPRSKKNVSDGPSP